MENNNAEVSEREKWEIEKSFRQREMILREVQIEIARRESMQSQWKNPLVLAILAASIAAAGNAVVAVVNGNLQRDLEELKSEQTRILEVIKVGGNPDKAAENLDFLLKSGLIRNPVQVSSLGKFLSQRVPGTGPSLPSAGVTNTSSIETANKNAAEKSATIIISMLEKAQYSDLWDFNTSDWLKKLTTKDAFIANMTLSRARLGRLIESKVLSNDFLSFDPSSGYTGPIYAITFVNVYAGSRIFERIVVIQEKDGNFRLSGIWTDQADKRG